MGNKTAFLLKTVGSIILLFALIILLNMLHIEWLAPYAGAVSLLLTALIMFGLWDKKANWSLGLRQTRGISHFAIGCCVAGVTLLLVIASLLLTGAVTVEMNSVDVTRLIVPIAGFFLVAVGEEVFFRGYLFGMTRNAIGLKGAVLVNMLLFSLLHLMNPQALEQPLEIIIVGQLNTLLITVVLIWFRLRSGGLWLAIGFHFMWNLLQSSVFGFVNGGKETESLWQVTYPYHSLWNGGMYGLEASVLITPLLLLLILWSRNREHRSQ